jgi:hypothetical protein
LLTAAEANVDDMKDNEAANKAADDAEMLADQAKAFLAEVV